MSGRRLPRRKGGSIALAFDRFPREGELDGLLAAGADMFELRLDMAGCKEPDEAEELAAAFSGAPMVATCRSEGDGGRGGEDYERLLLLSATVRHATAIDIELSSASILSQAAMVSGSNGCELVVSHHDTKGTPSLDHLLSVADQAAAEGADIVKVATTANSDDDVDTLVKLMERQSELGREAAVMGMGANEFSGPSRVRLAAAGSVYVFAQAGIESAPGQPSLAWLASELDRD